MRLATSQRIVATDPGMRQTRRNRRRAVAAQAWKTARVTSWLRALAADASASLITCCAIVFVCACAHPGAPARPRTNPTAGIAIDGLIISVDDVRRIAMFDGLTQQPQLEMTQPPTPNPNAPIACQAVGNTNRTFGNNWIIFHAVSYTAAVGSATPAFHTRVIALVRQTIAAYPSSDAAHTALDGLVSALAECAALHANADYQFTMEMLDPSTATLKSTDNTWTETYRVKSSVLIDVLVSGLPSHGPTANSILSAITDRVT